MTFFEKVKDILPRSVTKLDVAYDIKLNLADNAPTKQACYKVDKLNKRITIYVKSLTKAHNKVLQEAIKSCFELGEFSCLVDESKIDLLNRLYKFDDATDNQTLSFFKPLLSRPDWEALRDSLFIRAEFRARSGIVSQLKQDVRFRYGERGIIISNLCTAGYFEHVMMPLFNSSRVEFQKYYDLAVDRAIAAFFVHSEMTVDQITKEMNRIIVSAKSCGLASIHIHGIGGKNISKIKRYLNKIRGEIGFTEKNIFIQEQVGVIVVEIILK